MEGETLESLYVSSMLALAAVLKPIFQRSSRSDDVKVWLTVRSVDRTTLLIDFLSDVLTESFYRSVLFTHLEGVTINETSFKGRICGQPVDKFDDEVKAVTYHEAELIKNDSGNWETRIIFDI